jgi:membrane protein
MWHAFTLPISLRELVRRTWREIGDDNCLGLAAQLAYYFVLALFPALIVIVAIGSYFPRSTLYDVLGTLGRFAPAEVVSLVRTQLDAILAAEQGGLLTVGVLGALWSSSAALTAIIDALNRAYDITESRAWWKVRLLAIVLTEGLSVFILTAFALVVAGPELAQAAVGWLGISQIVAWVWRVVQWPLVFGLVAFGIACIYYFAPDADQDWFFLTPGSVLATVLWLLASLGFRFYVQNFGDYNATYGALGAAAILLLWLYVSSLAILIGAEVNAEIEHASPLGKDPGEKRPGERRRLWAFIRRPRAGMPSAVRGRETIAAP